MSVLISGDEELDDRCESQFGEDRCPNRATQEVEEPYTPGRFRQRVCDDCAKSQIDFGYRLIPPPAVSDYRPKATKYLVLWPDDRVGGFEHEDVLCCAIAENQAKETAQIFNLTCTLPTIYEPTSYETVREIAWPSTVHLDNPAPSFGLNTEGGVA